MQDFTAWKKFLSAFSNEVWCFYWKAKTEHGILCGIFSFFLLNLQYLLKTYSNISGAWVLGVWLLPARGQEPVRCLALVNLSHLNGVSWISISGQIILNDKKQLLPKYSISECSVTVAIPLASVDYCDHKSSGKRGCILGHSGEHLVKVMSEACLTNTYHGEFDKVLRFSPKGRQI